MMQFVFIRVHSWFKSGKGAAEGKCISHALCMHRAIEGGQSLAASPAYATFLIRASIRLLS
jgi:hypothetical protein